MSRPNRRTLITATPAALLVAVSEADARSVSDNAEEVCLHFVALQDRSTTLSDEWPVLESWLIKKYPDFIGKSDEEQALYPEAARFRQIQRERDAADSDAERLLPLVIKCRCRTPAALVAKLMAAERMTCRDENPEIKRLLFSAVSDLGELFSVRTWQWKTPWPNRNGPGTSSYEPS